MLSCDEIIGEKISTLYTKVKIINGDEFEILNKTYNIMFIKGDMQVNYENKMLTFNLMKYETIEGLKSYLELPNKKYIKLNFTKLEDIYLANSILLRKKGIIISKFRDRHGMLYINFYLVEQFGCPALLEHIRKDITSKAHKFPHNSLCKIPDNFLPLPNTVEPITIYMGNNTYSIDILRIYKYLNVISDDGPYIMIITSEYLFVEQKKIIDIINAKILYPEILTYGEYNYISIEGVSTISISEHQITLK